MRKFIIENPDKFGGTAELSYNEKGTLFKIDLTNSIMDEMTVQHFKQAVPSNIVKLINGNAFSAGTTVIEGDLIVTFEMFWNAYRQKLNKKRTEQTWKKLDKVKQVKAFYGVSKYDKHLTRESWKKKADPDTYLKNEMWENEYK